MSRTANLQYRLFAALFTAGMVWALARHDQAMLAACAGLHVALAADRAITRTRETRR